MIPQYIPMVNREKLAKEINDYILSDGRFTEFQNTKKLEQNITEFLNVNHCSMVNNGTIGLSLALLAYDIKHNDKVLVPNITMIATSNAVKLIGAIPIFIDVDEKNLCMSLKEAELAMRKDNKIKAMIYVSLNGRTHSSEELESIKIFCYNKKIAYIEDNAQSFGSNYNNKSKISCSGEGIGSFSFSMPKIITTGQGGCLVTNNETLYNKIQKLKDFGREKGGTDIHNEFGINSKFTEIQAIMGINQLEDIDDRISKKKHIYKTYQDYLKDIPQIRWIETNLNHTTPWFVDIYLDKRDELHSFFNSNGVQTRKIYPELTSQKTNNCAIKSLPISKKYSEQGLWLPSSMSLTDSDIKRVCDLIKEFYSSTVNTIHDLTLYKNIEWANKDIRKVSKNFKYAKEGQDYDLKNNLISKWFNPDMVKKSATSRTYPQTAIEQFRKEYTLILYPSNYLSLLLINLFYSDNKNVLIEDIGAGVGHWIVYLKCCGFSNFNIIEDFSQMSKDTLEQMMRNFNIQYQLNNFDATPTVMNCVAIFEPGLLNIKKQTELICFYTNPLIEKWANENLLNNGFVTLCKDQDNFQIAYCRKEKFEEFNNKIKGYKYE